MSPATSDDNRPTDDNRPDDGREPPGESAVAGPAAAVPAGPAPSTPEPAGPAPSTPEPAGPSTPEPASASTDVPAGPAGRPPAGSAAPDPADPHTDVPAGPPDPAAVEPRPTDPSPPTTSETAGSTADGPNPLRRARTLAVGAAAVLVLILLGAPFGLLWRMLAPSVPLVKTANGVILTQPEPEEFIAADGWFSLLGLGFGVLAAIAVWLILRRYRGPVGMVVVVLGAIGAATLAWRLGREIGLSEYHRLLQSAPVGATFAKPPDLRAGGFEWLYGVIPTIHGDLLVPAFGAVVTYTLLAGWSRWPTLQPEPPALSWDLPAPPAPQAVPEPPGPGAAEPPRD